MLYLFAESGTINFHGGAAYGFILIVVSILLMLLGLLALPALIVAAIARRQAEHIRNKRASTIVAQYDPPRGLSPAEVGLLYDMHCGQNEIMATLFDLEQRGIVRIIDARSVAIADQAAYANLAKYEKIAIRLARGETSELDTQRTLPITMTNADTGATYQFNLPLPQQKSLRAFSNAVQQSVASKGIPMQSFAWGFITRTLIITAIVALLPMLTAGLPITSNDIEYSSWSSESFSGAAFLTVIAGIFLVPVYAGFAALMIGIWAKLAGRYWINTRQARAVWPELEGYKLYLEQVDLDNIQFESTDHGANPVTKTLPYAIVFGLDTRWQARLQGVHTEK